jgi:hypothetical protein
MREFAFLFGFAALTSGFVMFVRIGNSERQFNAKVQSIHDGKVQPETLTVIRKYIYINSSRRGGGWPHVVFRSSKDPKVNCGTTREFYDSVNTNSTVTGYYFQDGYFVPQSLGGDAGSAKWVFLGFGSIAGAGLLLVGFTAGKTRPLDGDTCPQGGRLQDLMTAIRNRSKRE